MTSSLLLTKLRRPILPPRRVPRPHLIQRLNEGLDAGRPLTLVSAPAGFGKTICVSEWVRELREETSWLSLDAADDEPGRFFTYLIAALQRIDEGIGGEVAAVLRGGQVPPAAVIGAALSNDMLSRNQRFLLVLDDFQFIDNQVILRVFARLAATPPPALHLVLITREDPALPLARLRAHNQMTEIRAGDLRFSRGETAVLLKDVLDLPLPPTAVTRLEERTEGWVVGLQLVGLSLRGRDNPADYITGLSGTHRHILSYLTEEVLNQQPAEIRDFLLQTAILEKLSGDLCDAVTGRGDSARLLEQLYRENLFLIPLDDKQTWYRYHHLFADMLRERRSANAGAETATLHRRAGQWYAAAAMPEQAIPHALAAADYDVAVRLIENHTLEMLMQWRVKRVDNWIDALPPAWAARSPKTNLSFAWRHLLHGDHRQVGPYLERLRRFFSDADAGELEPEIEGEWLALQATLLAAQGQAGESLALSKQALQVTPAEDSHVRSLIYLSLAGAYRQKDRYKQALAAYQKLIDHARAAGNMTAELLGRSALGLLALHQGRLHLAFQTASQGLEWIERSGALPPLSTALYGELGEVHYQWRQLESAHAHFRRAARVSALSGYRDAEIYHAVVRSRLHQIEGDLDAAAAEIAKAVALMQREGAAAVTEEVIAQQVRVYLAQQRLAAAQQALAGAAIGEIGPEQPLTYPLGLLHNSALRVRLYQARATGEVGRLPSAVEQAGYLIDGAQRRQYVPIALKAFLHRAQMYAVLGNEAAAQADYAQALALGRPEGFISAFVEEGTAVAAALASLPQDNLPEVIDPAYLEEILAAFPAGVKAARPQPQERAPSTEREGGLIEPLSERELEVLRLIREGLSNREIAQQLAITLHTVKKHNSNIYGKLGVSSRTQAVARARRLGLL